MEDDFTYSSHVSEVVPKKGFWAKETFGFGYRWGSRKGSQEFKRDLRVPNKVSNLLKRLLGSSYSTVVPAAEIIMQCT